jgi:hypothetical protein
MSTPQPTYDDILRLFQETDRRLKEIAEQSGERSKEIDRQFKETDRKIKEVTASIRRLGNRLGDFIEYAVRPAAVRLFRERGIEVHDAFQNLSLQQGAG